MLSFISTGSSFVCVLLGFCIPKYIADIASFVTAVSNCGFLLWAYL